MNNEKIDNYLNNQFSLYAFIQSRLLKHKKRVFKYADVSFKDAAVLIPIFFKDKKPHVLFTKRTEFVAHHKGQISFPGGAYDPEDTTLQQTALRETWEEMGIKSVDITILGETDKLLTNTNFLVTPFVGYFSYPYKYTINTDEIDSIIEVPLCVLMDPTNYKIKEKIINQVNHKMHYYYYKDTVIWGVTGFLISNFLEIIFNIKHSR